MCMFTKLLRKLKRILNSKIEKIESLKLNKNDILIVSVDLQDMSNSKASLYVKHLTEIFKKLLDENGYDNKFVVISDKISISKISKEDVTNLYDEDK